MTNGLHFKGKKSFDQLQGEAEQDLEKARGLMLNAQSKVDAYRQQGREIKREAVVLQQLKEAPLGLTYTQIFQSIKTLPEENRMAKDTLTTTLSSLNKKKFVESTPPKEQWRVGHKILYKITPVGLEAIKTVGERVEEICKPVAENIVRIDGEEKKTKGSKYTNETENLSKKLDKVVEKATRQNLEKKSESTKKPIGGIQPMYKGDYTGLGWRTLTFGGTPSLDNQKEFAKERKKLSLMSEKEKIELYKTQEDLKKAFLAGDLRIDTKNLTVKVIPVYKCSVCEKELGKRYLSIAGVFYSKDLTSHESVIHRFCSVECYLIHKFIDTIFIQKRSTEKAKESG